MKNDKWWINTEERDAEVLEVRSLGEVNNGNVGGVAAQSNYWNAACSQPGSKHISKYNSHVILYGEFCNTEERSTKAANCSTESCERCTERKAKGITMATPARKASSDARKVRPTRHQQI
jgi:hypothetical protein